MKLQNLLLLSIFLCFTAVLHAQEMNEEKVSQAVQTSFDQAFAGAQDVQWVPMNNQYKVSFKTSDNLKAKGVFSATGKLVSYEKEIYSNNLPLAAVSYLRTEMPKYGITEATEFYSNGTVHYRMRVRGGENNEVKTLKFTEEGELIPSK